MADRNRVIHSFNLDGELRCVDVFQRTDGTYGFEEYRREAEDPRGWFPVGCYAQRRYETAKAALIDARTHVPWLSDVAPN